MRGWGQSVWWVAFGFVRRAPRLQRLAIGAQGVRSAGPSGWTLFPTMPQGSEAHPSAIRGNLYEPRSRYTTCDAVVLPEEALRRCRRPWKPSCIETCLFKLVLENPLIRGKALSIYLAFTRTQQCNAGCSQEREPGHAPHLRAASVVQWRPIELHPRPRLQQVRVEASAALQPPNRTLLFRSWRTHGRSLGLR